MTTTDRRHDAATRTFGRRGLVRGGLGLGAALALGAGRHRPASAQGHHSLAAQGGPAGGAQASRLVGDVLDVGLDPAGRWAGPFGSVTLRLHEAFFEGQSAWFVRTDASDLEFARGQGLVYAPLIGNALRAPGSTANLYLFAQPIDGQRPVLSTVPGRPGFSSAFRVHYVAPAPDAPPALLDSEAAVRAAEQTGAVTVLARDVVVNYPLVVWPGGGLAADPDLTAPLGGGPLVEAPDTAGGRVTFKLHQCYPGSRYIATDTSAGPMAPMMGIVPSEATQALLDVGATAPIYVFGNGIPGPGAMGFQPAIFNSKAGDPVWSPFWDHVTAVWSEGATPAVLRTEAELFARRDAGELQLFKGTPDSGGMGFVVNCPAQVLAPNIFDAGAAPATPTA